MSLCSFSILQFISCGPETLLVNKGGTQQQITVQARQRAMFFMIIYTALQHLSYKSITPETLQNVDLFLLYSKEQI